MAIGSVYCGTALPKLSKAKSSLPTLAVLAEISMSVAFLRYSVFSLDYDSNEIIVSSARALPDKFSFLLQLAQCSCIMSIICGIFLINWTRTLSREHPIAPVD